MENIFKVGNWIKPKDHECPYLSPIAGGLNTNKSYFIFFLKKCNNSSTNNWEFCSVGREFKCKGVPIIKNNSGALVRLCGYGAPFEYFVLAEKAKPKVFPIVEFLRQYEKKTV